ncbi:XapX domain-containing protein [Salinigranum sp.]|uniref:XapX domain-containing protein n=1 Tax=Salinigranum sp. TaxID=1966351 RepID=UPI00356A964A
MEWLKAALISVSAGILIGGVLAAADLPSPAPQHYLGVVAGAFTLVGMFFGTYAVNHADSLVSIVA